MLWSLILCCRYYAHALLTCLHRSIAVPEWARLRRGELVSLERALGAFDLFVPESGYGDLDEVGLCASSPCAFLSLAASELLTTIQVKETLEDLVAQFKAFKTELDDLSPRNKALSLASWLRDHDLTGIEPGREYHALEHNFLGLALKSPGHNSLPLICGYLLLRGASDWLGCPSLRLSIPCSCHCHSAAWL